MSFFFLLDGLSGEKNRRGLRRIEWVGTRDEHLWGGVFWIELKLQGPGYRENYFSLVQFGLMVEENKHEEKRTGGYSRERPVKFASDRFNE